MARLTCIKPTVRSINTMTARPAVKSADPWYKTPEHIAWRAAVLKRAGYRCEVCGKSSGRLYADHIVEISDGGNRTDPMNGQCLCASHHVEKTISERAKRLARPAR